MDVIAIIALIIAVLALVLALIAFIWFMSHRSNITNHGIAWIVQVGTTTAGQTSDTMQTGGNNFYWGAAPQDITLTIAANNTNVEGSTIEIFNGSANTITLVPGSGVNLNTAGVAAGTTVDAGTLCIFVATDLNRWLRVQ